MSSRATEQTDSDKLSQGEVLLNRTSLSPGTSGQTLEYPTNWISWRFTTPYRQRIEELFQDHVPYLAALETSKQGVEHYHVLTLDGYESTRKRIQRNEYWKRAKNTWWSKKNDGTFEKALAYTTKDGKYWKTDDFPNYEFTPWVRPVQPTIPAEPASKRARCDPDRDWQLTYSNLVTQAYKYHRQLGAPIDWTLKRTVSDMIKNTKWRPSYQLVSKGVPEFYEDDFLMRIGGRKDPPMSWWVPQNR